MWLTHLFAIDKINSINARTPDLERIIKHVLASHSVPGALVSLIARAKRSQSKTGHRTIESCKQALADLEKKSHKHKSLQLHSELVSLFKSHGQLGFASRSAPASINGYDIAQIISEFYRDPKCTTIDLPDYIDTTVRVPLKKIIDDERSRQLRKMVL